MAVAFRYLWKNSVTIVDGGTSQYVPISGTSATVTTANHPQWLIKQAYTGKLAFIRVSAFSGAGSIETMLRVNGTGTTSVIANIATTGYAEDTTNTVSLSATDKLGQSIVRISGMHGESVTVTMAGSVLELASSEIGALVHGQIDANTTTFYLMPGGTSGNGSSTETDVQRTFRTAATLASYSGNLTSAGGTFTGRVRVNSANGNGVISSASTGYLEDTTNSDTIAAGDKVAFSYVMSASTGTLAVGGIQTSSSARQHNSMFQTTSASGAVTNYSALTDHTTSTTESDAQITARTTNVYKNLWVYASSFSGSATTVDLRVGGTSSALTLSVSATGITEDTTHSVTVAATDLLNFREVIPASSSVTVRAVSVEETQPSSGVAISASLTGTGSASGTLQAETPVAATMSGAGSVSSGTLRAETPITASLSGTGALAGNVQLEAPAIAAALSGTGTLAGTVGTEVQVSAALNGTGALSASVEVVLSMSAALTGTGSLTGALGTEIPITPALSGTGSLAGTLGATETPISAALTGAGSLAGNVQLEAPAIAAALTGTGSLTGAVGTEVQVTASISGTGSLTATIDTVAGDIGISAALSGTGALSGTLLAETPISAALTGAGTLSGAVGTEVVTAASISGTGSLTGALGTEVQVTASLSGAGSLTGTLGTEVQGAAALTGTGSLTGTLGTEVQIAAALTGTGSLSSQLDASTPISAALSGAGSLTGTIDVEGEAAISAALSGTGTLTGALGVDVPVTAALQGTGTLSATLAADTPITAALSGTGSLTAAVEVPEQVAISAALTATGSLTASIDVPAAPVEAAPTRGGGTRFPFPLPRRKPEPVYGVVDAVLLTVTVTLGPPQIRTNNRAIGTIRFEPRMEGRAGIGERLYRDVVGVTVARAVASCASGEIRTWCWDTETRDMLDAQLEPLVLLALEL